MFKLIVLAIVLAVGITINVKFVAGTSYQFDVFFDSSVPNSYENNRMNNHVTSQSHATVESVILWVKANRNVANVPIIATCNGQELDMGLRISYWFESGSARNCNYIMTIVRSRRSEMKTSPILEKSLAENIL